MSFDWREFLALARVLQQSPHTSYSIEAAQRSAVSRAYYAAFCYLRNYAENHMGFRRTGSADDHKHLRDLLRNQGGAWSSAATKLDRLRQLRNQCDYDDSVSANLNMVTSTAITTAEGLINARPST